MSREKLKTEIYFNILLRSGIFKKIKWDGVNVNCERPLNIFKSKILLLDLEI